MYCAEAAVELLIGHRYWLARDDFGDRFVEVIPALAGDAEMAFVDWVAALAALDAGGVPCSASEAQILGLAASLAAGIPLNLRDAVTGLDEANAALVAEAVMLAAGVRVSGRRRW